MNKFRIDRKWKKIFYLLAVLVVFAVYQLTDTDKSSQIGSVADEARVLSAFKNKRSDIWVELSGTIKKVLSDDNTGSRHQRFIIQLDNGHTLMVAHNIDLANRVPVVEDDELKIHGRYEWNKKGGVLHWTHHDPNGKITGGWIEHKGHTYH